MSDETTTEQLAEIEGQGESTPVTGYTPPDGWRLLAVGELVMLDDQWVRQDGSVWRSMGTEGPVSEGSRYIRQIKPEPVQIREGQWRTRDGNIRNVTPTPECDNRHDRFPWRDTAYDQTWREDGGHHIIGESPSDLVEYLGPIEQQPETQQNGLVRDVTHLLQESGVLDSAKAEQQIEELRSEVAYVQNQLGESRQRVTQLEELVVSLRTINKAQEKSFRLAGQANTDLQHRLNVVSAEWAEQSETVRKLRIELDAAQQVPQAIADRFEEGWNQGTARAIETVLEWLQPIRAVDNEHLANETLQHLPQIMRHLTGLAQD